MRRWMIVFAIAVSSISTSAAPDVVKVDGGQISGTSANGVRIFKGIPFAAPPVGDLRWKAPQPMAAWQGVRAAGKFGASCMQEPYLELGDAVQIKNHLLKAQLDFLEGFQQRRQTSQ